MPDTMSRSDQATVLTAEQTQLTQHDNGENDQSYVRNNDLTDNGTGLLVLATERQHF